MIVRAHLRVAKHPRGGKHKIAVSTRPSPSPLTDSSLNAMPTIAFAIDLNIPDEMFVQAQRVVATIDVSADDVTIPVKLVQP